jgi:hypothetical protein
MNAFRTPPSVCPNCSEPVPPSALACPECGADWDTGWKDLGGSGFGADAPEEAFDYDAAFEKEFGESPKPEGMRPLWWITGIAILVLFLFGALRAIF